MIKDNINAAINWIIEPVENHVSESRLNSFIGHMQLNLEYLIELHNMYTIDSMFLLDECIRDSAERADMTMQYFQLGYKIRIYPDHTQLYTTNHKKGWSYLYANSYFAENEINNIELRLEDVYQLSLINELLDEKRQLEKFIK